jgi:uncharacterized repeat protein (TIGR02543 family)
MTSTCTGYGFHKAHDVQEDGEYTLYSKTSSEGEYNILKINTPNPDEYYLSENRYVSKNYKGEAFDEYGISNKQGILIWNVDEDSFSRAGANNATSDKDPTLAVYATNTKNIARGDKFPAAFGGTVDVFNPTEYKFPHSKTWYTSMTAEEAEIMKNLRIEVISEPGEEMKIKITGSYKQVLPPEFSMFFYDKTKTSATVKGELRTLNYSTMTSAKFIVSDKKTGNVVKEQELGLKSDYTYEIALEGLTPGTAYKCKIVAESTNGQVVLEEEVYTLPEEAKYANISLVINSDQYTTITQKVKVGTEHVIRVKPTKYGYYIEGWYLDEGYTQKYTPGKIENESDFTIYAKWVQGTDPSATTAGTVATNPTTTAPQIPDNMPTNPIAGGCGGSAKGAEPMLLGGAVIAILGAAAGKKRKEK